MPKPKKGETQKEFVSRCIPIVVNEGTAKDNKQAAAICYSMWRESKEEKDMNQREEKMVDGCAVYRPMGGATSFAEYQDMEEAREAAWKIQDLTYQYQGIIENIMVSDIEDKQAALRTLTEEFLSLVDDLPKSKSLWDHVKDLFSSKGKQEDVKEKQEGSPVQEKQEATHPFSIWKDTETGQYRWIAIYSNRWRDNDNPPEILASSAHKEFEEALDKGDWPYPEAWLWHIPGTRFGVADFVTYDDSGFALASGTVDKGKEDVAEALAQEDDLATSHGMPVKEIERDKEDSTIITRYRSVEISPLPREAAANKYGTGFEIIQEVKMAIPEHKRPSVEKWLGADRMKALEDFLADKSKELDELNIQSKDTTEDVEEDVAAQEVEEGGEEDAEPKEAPAEETPEYVTVDEVAEAVGSYLKPVLEQLQAISALSETVEELGKAVKGLQRETDEMVKETIANTPAHSLLFDKIGSVIGSDETLIDGRTSLAKSGPKETHDDRDGPAKVGLINELMAQAWGQ